MTNWIQDMNRCTGPTPEHVTNKSSDTEKTAKAGHLICVDSGAYSDYSVTGFFCVLKDFQPMAELASYLDAHPEDREDYSFNEDRFLAWLLAKGLLLEITYGTLYLSGYSTASKVRFTPMWTVEEETK